MPGTDITINQFGLKGVNVDKNPLQLDNDELTQAQNCIPDVSVGLASIRKRYGLIPFNTNSAAGSVLGGIDMPQVDQSLNGVHTIYIGRGATA